MNICLQNIQGAHKTDLVDVAQHSLLFKVGRPEAMTLTCDYLCFHLVLIHNQARIWTNAHGMENWEIMAAVHTNDIQ